MCLDVALKEKEVPKSRPILAWKVFKRATGRGLVGLFYHQGHEPYRTGRIYPVWCNLGCIRISADSGYRAGFHAYMARRVAAAYKAPHEAVRCVALWGRVTLGKQEGWRVAVGQYMKILPKEKP